MVHNVLGIFSNKLVCICLAYNNSHTFLAFRNSKLSTIKAIILLRNLVKINNKTVCKFTDSNGNTASTKVITLLDKLGNFFATE